jgi:hypothetical protein
MKKTHLFTALTNWLYSTEMFARPFKEIPGKWRLFECYSEPGDHLVNMKEEDLEQAGYYWNIDFEEYGSLTQEMNLPVKFLTDASECNWQTARNFLKLTHKESPGIIEEFQYAISKGNLKLLQKDSDGKIIFFGFFRKIDKSKY